MLSSPIRTLCVVACAVLAVVAYGPRPDGPQAKVTDLLAQAQAQATGIADPEGQPAVAAPSQTIDLTMDDAVAKALKLNIDLSVERLNPQLQDLALKGAYAVYVPTVERPRRAQHDIAAGQHDRRRRDVNTKKTTYNFNASQGIKWTGATASINWNNSRQAPTTTLHAQPALRHQPVRLDHAAALAEPGDRQQPPASSQPKSTAGSQTSRCAPPPSNTLANTRNAYWDLVYAIQAVESAKTSLALAQKLVEDNKIRVEIGTLAPLDVVWRRPRRPRASRRWSGGGDPANGGTGAQAADCQRHRRPAVERDAQSGRSAGRPTRREDQPEAALRTALENRTDVVTARGTSRSATSA